MDDRLAFYTPCARGLEPLLADELRRLNLKSVRPQRGGVLFGGRIAEGYRALLWSRLASRVLLSLGEVDASSADALYEGTIAIAWEDHVRASGTIAVDAAGTNEALRNTQFTAVRVKDAVADRFRARFDRRPSVDTRAPELRINVVIRNEKAKIAIDLSGEPMHRRGYRQQGVQVAAPMKETLAAAVLEIAGWREFAAEGGAFLDPMCGSGTLPIEAAMVASDMAPGLLRQSWGFDRWLGHDADAWARLIAKADERCEAGRATIPPIRGSDSDAKSIAIARDFVRRAGFERNIELAQEPLSQVVPPEGAARGLVACNPPYGERLAERRDLPVLYRELAGVLRERFAGWELAAITSDDALEGGLGARATRSAEVFNGRIPAKVYVFEDFAGGSGASAQGAGFSKTDAADVAGDPAAEAFANRLKKMAKHYGTWARRSGITCYRVYDADLPDYNVAIDVYSGAAEDAGRLWVHIAEYAAPAGIDPDRAEERLQRAEAIACEVFGVEPDSVFVKRRERQRGSAQYERVSSASVTGVVAENGLLFEVNFSDYLDTGLFLDHRDTRAWMRELAAGKRFLNLFAYTGTASVYTAAGGAASTTTVDLSATYLDWANRNLKRNGFGGADHSVVRADVLTWIRDEQKRGGSYDLVFCDPPTFSNSKRMDETWDVQRDHAAFIEAIAGVLTEDGLLVFSCNRRKFELDEAALAAAGLQVRDVTRRTTPKDFDRLPPAHQCWTIRR